jgi:hypothetical protein
MCALCPLWLQVGGEKPVEGHPKEAGQARMQMSIHVKVVGLSLVLRGTFQPVCSRGHYPIY